MEASEPSPEEVTRLLRAADAGAEGARAELLELVYGELRAIAGARMRGERRDHTLGATGLVSEAYLRLFRTTPDADAAPEAWRDRAGFFAAASTAMRRILVDHARARSAGKRGGGAAPARGVALDAIEAACTLDPARFIALDAAIDRLAALDDRAAEVVRLRFFGGVELEAIAAALGVTSRTVKRDWQFARAWLREALHETTMAGGAP